jgi:hypothetical protein
MEEQDPSNLRIRVGGAGRQIGRVGGAGRRGSDPAGPADSKSKSGSKTTELESNLDPERDEPRTAWEEREDAPVRFIRNTYTRSIAQHQKSLDKADETRNSLAEENFRLRRSLDQNKATLANVETALRALRTLGADVLDSPTDREEQLEKNRRELQLLVQMQSNKRERNRERIDRIDMSRPLIIQSMLEDEAKGVAEGMRALLLVSSQSDAPLSRELLKKITEQVSSPETLTRAKQILKEQRLYVEEQEALARIFPRPSPRRSPEFRQEMEMARAEVEAASAIRQSELVERIRALNLSR